MIRAVGGSEAHANPKESAPGLNVHKSAPITSVTMKSDWQPKEQIQEDTLLLFTVLPYLGNFDCVL